MSKLHNAEVSLELCRAILAQRGQGTASMALRGMELYSVDSARLALGILRHTTVYGTAAMHAKEQAIQALEEAVCSTDTYGDA